MKFGLHENDIAMIRDCFAQSEGIERVVVFGSRALGTQRENSDIDLAYQGDLSDKEHNALYARLDNLPLPYLFDLKNTAEIRHPRLKEHIKRVGEVLYEKAPRAVS